MQIQSCNISTFLSGMIYTYWIRGFLIIDKLISFGLKILSLRSLVYDFLPYHTDDGSFMNFFMNEDTTMAQNGDREFEMWPFSCWIKLLHVILW